MRLRHLITVLFTILVMPQGTFAKSTPVVEAELIFYLGNEGIQFVDLNIKRDPTIQKQPVIFVLPFMIENVLEDAENLLGIKNYRQLSIVTVAFEPTRSEVSLRFTVNRKTSLNGVKLAQYGLGTSLVVPKEPLFNLTGLKGLKQFEGLSIVDNYSLLKATFPAGFSLIDQRGKTELYNQTTVELKLEPKRNQYEVLFIPARSDVSLTLDAIFARVVIVLIGVIVTLMAPGFIPSQYYLKCIIALISIIVIFLGFRWFITIKDRNSITSVLSDTILASVYLGIIAIVHFLRERGKSKGTQT